MHLDPPIDWALQEELTGLVLASSLLQQVAGGADALISVGQILDHPRLQGLADVVARNAVQISTFGTEPMDGAVVMTCLTATLIGQGLRVRYRNRGGRRARRHVAPLRMLFIRNEWYCVVWERGLRTYRISRMLEAEVDEEMPPGMPGHVPPSAVDELLAPAFYATASTKPGDLVEVVLAVGPGAWPQVQGRTWGLDQEIEEEGDELPEGWRRIRFTTAGLMECRHWVLSMGAEVRAEGPGELVEWVRGQALGADSIPSWHK